MAKLVFKIESDYEKVIKLREEIDKLKASMRNFDGSKMEMDQMGKHLGKCQSEMRVLTQAAAQAGAEMDNNLKKKIFGASQSVNDFTEKIIKQKSVVKDVEADVKRLSETYRDAVKSSPLTANGIKADLKAAKKVLEEERSALFELTQQQAEARLSVKRLKDEYSLYNNEVDKAAGKTDLIGSSMKKAFIAIGGVYALKELATSIVSVRGEFQAMETSLQTLLGSKEKTDVLMSRVKEYAKISPLDLKSVSSATQMMLGFNIEAEKVPRFLSAIGDIAMGDVGRFNSLTLAFSQMSATGKLMGQDLNQMINAGFNPLTVMAEKSGKSIAQLKEEMSKGAITTEMVQQAFIDATSAGGKFYKMSEDGSKTINGQTSMMHDAIDNVLNEIGSKSEGLIMKGIQGATSLINNYETIGKVLVGLVATYGSYRTAILLLTAAESKHTIAEIALTNVRIAARKAQLALNASMLTNPYVALAVVVGALVTTMWAMSDSTNAAEKAQKKYNEAKEKATQEEKDHKAKIEELIDSARDESLATLTRERSLEVLQKAYPKIFEKYDIEKLKLEDIIKLKKQINEEDNLKVQIKQKDDYSSLQSLTKRLQRYLDLYNNYDLRKNITQSDKNIWNEFSGTPIVKIKEKLSNNYETLKLLEKDLLADNLASYKAKISKFSKDKVNAEIEALREARKTGKRITINGISIAGSRLDPYLGILKEVSSQKTKDSTFQQDYNKAKKEWEDAKKKLSDINKDKEKFTSKQYEEAKKMYESKRKAYEDLGGDTSGKIKTKSSKIDSKEQDKSLALEKKELESLLTQYQGYIDKRKSLEQKYQSDRDKLIAAGANQASLYENEYQKDKALKAVDEEFAKREDDYQKWADSITNITLDKLQEMLYAARMELNKMETDNPNNAKLALARTKIYELEGKIKNYKQEEVVPSPETSSLKKWQDMYTYLQKVNIQLQNIGKEMDGVAGEMISFAGDVTSSAMAMIDGVKTLTDNTVMAIDSTGVMAARTMSTIEKASVILGILSAGMQIMLKIGDFSDNKAFKDYEVYAEKIKNINALTDAVNEYRIAALQAKHAEEDWFSEDNLKTLRDYKKVHDVIAEAYFDKIWEKQAIYQNKSGGGWVTNFWNTILDNSYGKIYSTNFAREYAKGQTEAINNLRIETRKKSSGFLGSGIGGKSQQTEELQTWINNNKDKFKEFNTELFDKDALLNKELAKAIIDNYGNKLVAQTKETLEALISLSEKYDEYIEKLHDYVSSMYEPIVDNLVSSIWDWFDEGKDALKSFKEYASDTFRDIVSDMMKTIVLDKVVGSFSKDISDIYEEYAKGKINEAELINKVAQQTKGLTDNYEKNLPALQAIMEQVDTYLKNVGIDLKSGSAYSQKASSKGFNAMSQDTGEELNGRFTAVHEESVKQNIALAQLNITAADIKVINSGIRDIADDARNIMANSYLELVSIRENTAEVIKPIKQIAIDISEVKLNTSKL